ncbi:hypothetical protein Hanom_Chr12g01115981 [Helianthus anomalus]
MDPLYFFFLILLSHYSSTNPKKNIVAALSPSYRHRKDPPSVPQNLTYRQSFSNTLT